MEAETVFGGSLDGITPDRVRFAGQQSAVLSLQELSDMLVLPPADAGFSGAGTGRPSEDVASLKLFRNVKPEAVLKLEREATAVAFARDKEIDTPPGTVLIVTHGELHIFLHDAAEKKFLLGTATAGDVVGEMSYLAPEGSDDQKVVLQALTPVKGLRVPSETFFEVVSHDPGASLNLMTLLAGRLGAMNRFAKQAVDIDIDPTKLETRSFGEKLADVVSSKVGSWRFLAGGMLFTAAWMGANAFAAATWGWDPYPFIFLNLVFSVISAATMPVLLMSQNRQTQLDRMAARANHVITMRATQLIGRVLKEQKRMQRAIRNVEAKVDRNSSQSEEGREQR